MLPKAWVAATLRPIILGILDEGEAYGYQIIQRIQSLSDGQIRWTTGTLYPMLHKLENKGLVTSSWQAVENAPRRKYYRLTPKGQKALEAERRQWMFVHRLLVNVLGLPPVAPSD